MTRRSLIAGAFGVLCSRSILPALVHREARTWIHIKEYTTPECVGWYGLRSDGVLFYVASRIFSEEESLDSLLNSRTVMDTFLESECSCRLGYTCDFHGFFRR